MLLLPLVSVVFKLTQNRVNQLFYHYYSGYWDETAPIKSILSENLTFEEAKVLPGWVCYENTQAQPDNAMVTHIEYGTFGSVALIYLGHRAATVAGFQAANE